MLTDIYGPIFIESVNYPTNLLILHSSLSIICNRCRMTSLLRKRGFFTKCSKCGNILPDDDNCKFCFNCGFKFEDKESDPTPSTKMNPTINSHEFYNLSKHIY